MSNRTLRTTGRRPSRFLADGAARIRRDEYARIRREITVRFAEEWAEAGLVRRLILRWRMRREIKRELSRIAPPGGLYAGRNL